MINYDNCTNEDHINIMAIARRAIENDPQIDIISFEMDLTAVHCNCGGLKLEEFLSAKEFDFYHDVYGIIANMDRTNIKLLNCFNPRYSK